MADIKFWRKKLQENIKDPGLVAWEMRELPEIKAAGLKGLAVQLSQMDGVHWMDVSGLIDLLNEHQGMAGSNG